MLQDEYYIIESNQDSCIFSWDQKSGSFGLGRPVIVTEPIKVRVGDPIPSNLKLVDFHEMPEPVLSQRIVDVLMPMDIYGVQLVPAKVRTPQAPSDEVQDYWFMHIWNRIHCLDIDNSKLEFSRSGRIIFGIDKLVLNEDVLESFELQNRKIFVLGESSSVLLVHKSIKDAIMSVNPVGCRFFKATEWNSDSSFS